MPVRVGPSPSGLPARVETVLLDAGGVLLDLDYAYVTRLIASRHAPAPALDALARAEAFARIEIERLVRLGGRVGEAWRDYFHLILGRVAVAGEHHVAIIDSLWEAHQRVGLWTVAVPGGPEAVAELKRRGLRVGVVSNAEGRVERDLSSAGYAGLFDVVVDSHLVGVEKPDPAIFRIALERLGADAATAVFAGDLPAVDLAGARAAGIAPVLVDPYDSYPEAGAPSIGSIAELPALVSARDPARS